MHRVEEDIKVEELQTAKAGDVVDTEDAGEDEARIEVAEEVVAGLRQEAATARVSMVLAMRSLQQRSQLPRLRVGSLDAKDEN